MIIKRRQRAFTLIELLIVIVIIGILAGLIVWAVRSAVVRARDAQAKNSAKVVQDALEVYMTENPNLRTSAFGSQFPNKSAYYPLTEDNLKELISGGQKLITTVPTDGQGSAVKLRVVGSASYIVEAKSASSSTKCWIASSGTSSSNTLPNLSASSPKDCTGK